MSQPVGASQRFTPTANECSSPVTATSIVTRDFAGDGRQDGQQNFAHPGVASPNSISRHASSTAPSPSPEQTAAALGHIATSEANLNYGFQPATPGSLWQWNNAMDFTNFNAFYDPQGQLAYTNLHTSSHAAGFVSELNPPFRPALDKTLSQTPTPPAVPQSPRGPSANPGPSIHSSQVKTTIGPADGVANKKRKVDAEVTFATPPQSADPPGELPRRHSTTKIPSTSEKMNSGPSSSARQGANRLAPPRRSSNVDSGTENAGPSTASERTKQFAEKGEFAQPKGRNQDASQGLDVRKIAELGKFNTVLPPNKVFPIQIGSELFRLSGASISSDSPSYFSHYFTEQLLQTNGKATAIKTLYIDRDPITFRDIALHLQGYRIKPRDGEHFVKLYADAQFYTLPRLTQQLFKSEIYIQVGDKHFQIPRDLFSSPGDSPNYFSLGFAHFFSTPTNTFPGVDQKTLLRPPSILPPSVPTRSASTFADLLHLLQGYDLKIRDKQHRAELLRDARYFHLKGLEQKLIPCDISYNDGRGRDEIVLGLEDIRQSGVAFASDYDAATKDSSSRSAPATPHAKQDATPLTGYITYQRPYVDGQAYELIIEIAASEAAKLDLKNMRATFLGQTKARISSLFQVVANKMNLPAVVPLGLMMLQSGGGVATQPVSPANSGVSEDRVKIRVGRDCWVEVDGVVLEWAEEEEDEDDDDAGSSSSESESEKDDDDDQPMASDDESKAGKPKPRKNKLPPVKQWKSGKQRAKLDWTARTSQWRVRVEEAQAEASKVEVVMEGVRIEAFTEEKYRNGKRGFLTA